MYLIPVVRRAGSDRVTHLVLYFKKVKTTVCVFTLRFGTSDCSAFANFSALTTTARSKKGCIGIKYNAGGREFVCDYSKKIFTLHLQVYLLNYIKINK